MTFDPMLLLEAAEAAASPDGGVDGWLATTAPLVASALDPAWRKVVASYVSFGESRQTFVATAGTVDLQPSAVEAALEAWLSSGDRRGAGVHLLPASTVAMVVVPAGEGRGVVFAIATEAPPTLDAPSLRLWERVAIHLAAPLRCVVQRRAARTDEAVPRDAGCLDTAPGLRAAVQAYDEQREDTSFEGEDVFALWWGLLMGRWVLVDRFMVPGRRFVVARPTEPRERAAHTRRQRQIVFHASLGLANKEIGYALGLSPNTVSSHLHRAVERLGFGSRTELITLATRAAVAFAHRAGLSGSRPMRAAAAPAASGRG
ncbi:MAG: helix-turn-helix transcriptional regulator [Polyangiaceae bacterium]